MGFPDAEPGTRGVHSCRPRRAAHGGQRPSRHEASRRVVEHARVLSSLLARAADVVATSLTDDIEGYRRAGLADADAAAAAVVQLRLLEISALVDYLFRRQLVTVLTRQLTATPRRASVPPSSRRR